MAGERFCRACGREFAAGAAPSPTMQVGTVRTGPPLGLLIGLAVVVALVGVGVAFLVGGSGEASSTVALVGAADPGADPFTESTSMVAAVEQHPAKFLDRADSEVLLTAVSGADEGLYQRGVIEPCDVARLTALVLANPQTAAVWAEVMGVDVASVGDTLASYAAVSLTRDTAVTNHAYRDGEAEPFAAVLQAGTDVLVDDLGQPRVRCACGNPLLPPAIDTPAVTFDGDAWDGFEPADVRSVSAAPEPMSELVTVDPDTGESSRTPVGMAGEVLDGYLVVGDAGVSVLGFDGTVSPVVTTPVGAAFDDGAGGLVYEPAGTGATGSIMLLPAGAAEPVELVPRPAPPAEVALHGVVRLGGRVYVAYSESVVSDEGALGSMYLRDLDGGAVTEVPAGATSFESGPGIVNGNGQQAVVPSYQPDGRIITLLGPDLVGETLSDWTDTACIDDFLCRAQMALDGHGKVLMLDDAASVGMLGLAIFDPVANAFERTIPLGVADEGFVLVDAKGEEAVVSFGSKGSTQPALLVDLASGNITELGATGEVRFLSSPLRRPELPKPPPGPPSRSIRDFDLMNTTLPGRSCFSDGWITTSQPIPVAGGAGSVGTVDGGDFAEIHIEPPVGYGDVNGDGTEDAVLEAVCGAGGTYADMFALVLTTEGDQLAIVGDAPLGAVAAEATGTSLSRIRAVRLEGSEVVVEENYPQSPDEPQCCFTGNALVRWRWQGGAWSNDGVQIGGA